VAVAFTSHNLSSVAAAYRGRMGYEFSLVIAGDNDHLKPLELGPNGRPKRNEGKVLAEEAALAVHGQVLLPSFQSGEEASDWNDYERLHGRVATTQALRSGLERARMQLAQESQLATDQLALQSIKRTGHDGERVAESIRDHEGTVQSRDAGASFSARFDTLRTNADREAAGQHRAGERPRRGRSL